MKLRNLIPLVLIAIVLVAGTRLSDRFLDIHYLMDSATYWVETGIVALAMLYVIVSGNIDLSVASNLTLTACLTAKVMTAGVPIPLAVAFSLVCGTSLGFVNGFCVTWFKLPSFLVTLGTMAIYRGVAQAMLGSDSEKLPRAFVGLDQRVWMGMPDPLALFLILAVVAGIGLNFSVFGRWVTAVGANASAAFYSAVPVDRVKALVFGLTGLACGIGAILMNSRLGVARPDFAQGMELDAITIVVVGGTAITGGDGNVVGAVEAFILVALLKAAMGVAGIKAEFQFTAMGIILILAVLAHRQLGSLTIGKNYLAKLGNKHDPIQENQ